MLQQIIFSRKVRYPLTPGQALRASTSRHGKVIAPQRHCFRTRQLGDGWVLQTNMPMACARRLRARMGCGPRRCLASDLKCLP